VDRFSFTLEVEGLDPRRGDYEDRLCQAGCNDALVAVIENTLFVDFDREAPSYEKALLSARTDVERAGGSVVRALPLTGL
jgi:hypothetical protein